MSIKEREELLDEPTLSVFHGQTPEPNRLALLPQLLSPRGQVRLPESVEHWARTKQKAIKRLYSEVFHLLDDVRQVQEMKLTVESTLKSSVNRYQWQGRLDGMTQALIQLAPADHSHEGVIIGVGGREQTGMHIAGDLWSQRGERNLAAMGIEPRAAGLTGFPEHCRTSLNREGCLVGLTPTMMMVQDLHHLWLKLKALPTVGDRKIYLYGKGEGAIAMLYHALLHPGENVKAVILEDLPASHTEVVYQIMGVLRVMDIPQAVGLLAPTPVALINPGEGKFEWYIAERAHQRVRGAGLVQAMNTFSAMEQLALVSDASAPLRGDDRREVTVNR